ncbi:MAG: response regulator [Vicinamibacteria bacterium]|nr:response regulator [Vicinamibacteria bacterium]
MNRSNTILLVDDDETARNAARRMIERLGYDVVAVASGQEGIATLSAGPERISCAILDLTMPDMDGRACLRALRAVRDDLPAVLTSGWSEQDHATSEPALTILPKPYRRNDLARILESLIG